MIMFMFHVDYLTFVSGCSGDGGAVTGENAAKPLTARVYVSTFVSVMR